MASPKTLKDDPAAYERVRMMTIGHEDGAMSYYHMLDESGYLPIQYQAHVAEGEDNKTGWTIHACDQLFRTWDEVVEYWPIHNEKMLERAK